MTAIEILFWEGCPSYPDARELLAGVLHDLGRDDEILMHEVTSQQEAEALRFPGSPTIRVEGRDVDPIGAEARPSLACRIYHLRDGRVSPIPAREDLEQALR